MVDVGAGSAASDVVAARATAYTYEGADIKADSYDAVAAGTST
jgi:hypothetical protein